MPVAAPITAALPATDKPTSFANISLAFSSPTSATNAAIRLPCTGSLSKSAIFISSTLLAASAPTLPPSVAPIIAVVNASLPYFSKAATVLEPSSTTPLAVNPSNTLVPTLVPALVKAPIPPIEPIASPAKLVSCSGLLAVLPTSSTKSCPIRLKNASTFEAFGSETLSS